MPKDFIDLTDFSAEEIADLVSLASAMKEKPQDYTTVLAGKTLGMIFEKHSTRTRVSFEVGIYQLGGIGLFFGPGQLQIARGEPIEDTGQVLSRYLQGIMIRTYNHEDVLKLAANTTIPVINGLTDYNHPCQALADLQTVRERFGKTEGLRFAYVGDGNNMAVSLMFACVKSGMDVALVSPRDYTVPDETVAKIQAEAEARGVKIVRTESLEEGATGAHIVYTDVWASMGQEAEQAKREKAFAGFTVDDRVMGWADRDSIFMHCLPAHRGEEVSASVIDGKQSIIFDQAENRLHAQKAVMATLMR